MGKIVIEWTEEALDDFARLDPPIQKRIGNKLDWLAEHFHRQTPETLSGNLAGAYKIRVGDWRVIYRLEEASIVIYAVGHRRKIYQR